MHYKRIGNQRENKENQRNCHMENEERGMSMQDPEKKTETLESRDLLVKHWKHEFYHYTLPLLSPALVLVEGEIY